MRNKQVKQKTRVDKIRKGRLKSTESSVRGSTKDDKGASLALILSDAQSRSDIQTCSQSGLKAKKLFVPVVDINNSPLMPTTPGRARRWIKIGKVTPFFKKGIFCVRLNIAPSNTEKQEICVGIDPGSKREAYTIKSESHTYLNILTETPNWIKDSIKTRREMRRNRRNRKTPCRQPRWNRSSLKNNRIPPSTKARWQLKLNMCKFLNKIFPITHYIVEDIKARTFKGAKKWNKSFSPLEVGKNWFYKEIEKIGILKTKRGYETKELRDDLGLKKNKSKLADKFECHNVDSWVLSNWCVGGHLFPDNTNIIKLIPLQFHRRQLHVLQPSKGGIRKSYGGTRSLGFKRGSLIKHKKYGLCYIGGTSRNRISVHSLKNGERLAQSIKPQDCIFKTYLSTRKGDCLSTPY
jgi:hypothetical protein